MEERQIPEDRNEVLHELSQWLLLFSIETAAAKWFELLRGDTVTSTGMSLLIIGLASWITHFLLWRVFAGVPQLGRLYHRYVVGMIYYPVVAITVPVDATIAVLLTMSMILFYLGSLLVVLSVPGQLLSLLLPSFGGGQWEMVQFINAMFVFLLKFAVIAGLAHVLISGVAFTFNLTRSCRCWSDFYADRSGKAAKRKTRRSTGMGMTT